MLGREGGLASLALRLLQAPGAAWLALAALLALGAWLMAGTAGYSGAGSNAGAAAWDWQPGLALAEPWRCWSAAWVHLSPQHLSMNLAGCGLLAWLGWRAGLRWRVAAAWALAWPLTQLGLGLQAGLLHYAGLSGVLHAGIALLGWELLRWHAERRERGLGGLLLLGLMLKLLSEQAWLGPVRSVAGWDFALAPGAHVSGAAAGLLCGMVLLRRHRVLDAPQH